MTLTNSQRIAVWQANSYNWNFFRWTVFVCARNLLKTKGLSLFGLEKRKYFHIEVLGGFSENYFGNGVQLRNS